MHRLEREVSHVLDMATSYRLEADLKERDLLNAQAELIADEEDFREVERRLQHERSVVQDLERRHAEAGAALRAAQHALKLESKRRAAAEEALDEATILADQRRLAIVALRAEADALRARYGEAPGAPVPYEIDETRLPRALTAREEAEDEFDADELVDVVEPQHSSGGSVVPLRPKAAQPDASEQSVGSDTGDAEARPATPRMPAATGPGPANVGELVALRMTPPEAAGPAKEQPDPHAGSAESRFFAALAEIRALKRSAGQAGE
jgi:hypothetical protein